MNLHNLQWSRLTAFFEFVDDVENVQRVHEVMQAILLRTWKLFSKHQKKSINCSKKLPFVYKIANLPLLEKNGFVRHNVLHTDIYLGRSELLKESYYLAEALGEIMGSENNSRILSLKSFDSLRIRSIIPFNG